MKKIITLIMMFVLSVSFLMAQGVFTYQTMVVDNNGVLVVNERVSGTVTITDGIADHIYTKTFNGKTSPNGMLTLSLEDEDEIFKAINWQNAQIAVAFDDEGASYTETIPAVPYALQAGSNALTTQMIVDYLTAPNTGAQDVEAILAALQSNPSELRADFIAAMVQMAKDNRLAAKEIFLHYLANATESDAQKLYDSLLVGLENEYVKDTLMSIAKELISNNKEMLYDVLSSYAQQLTPADVNAILLAVPEVLQNKVVAAALNYLAPESGEASQEVMTNLIIPVLRDYVANVTVSEMQQLINALKGNTSVYNDVLIPQFNAWMAEYFADRYPDNGDGADLQAFVNQYIAGRYYPNCEVDLCALMEQGNCFSLTADASAFTFSVVSDQGDNDNYVGTTTYTGDAGNVVVDSVRLFGPNNTSTLLTTNDFKVIFSNGTMTLTVMGSVVSLTPGESFTATFYLHDGAQACAITTTTTPTAPTFEVTGYYTEPGEVIEPGHEGGSNCNNPFHIEDTSTEFTLLPADGEYYTATINYAGETPNAISGVYLSYGQINNQTVNENDVILNGDGSVLTVRINHVPYSGDNTNGYLVPSPSSLAPGESFTVELTLHDVCGGYGTTVSFTYTKPQN